MMFEGMDEAQLKKILEDNDWDLQKSINPLIQAWSEMEDKARQVS